MENALPMDQSVACAQQLGAIELQERMVSVSNMEQHGVFASTQKYLESSATSGLNLDVMKYA